MSLLSGPAATIALTFSSDGVMSGACFRYGTGFWIDRDLTGSDRHVLLGQRPVRMGRLLLRLHFRRNSFAHDFSEFW